MVEIVKKVESFAEKNGVNVIDTLVLQIGELSSVVPAYIESVYRIAADGSKLENTKLKIEVTPGNARCLDCGEFFRVLASKGLCPKCGGKALEVFSGKEFTIKEIVCI